MWSALENIALRESLPKPLKAGESVHDILIAGQLNRGRHNLHHLGRRRSEPYLLKQFYSLDTNAFLRWQNEARFIPLQQEPGFLWPSEEWRGGLIAPFSGDVSLDSWLEDDDHSPEERLSIASLIARRIARLHASDIAHRGLSPSCIRIGERGISIGDFGYARCDEWDDLWADSILSATDKTCASPESLRGEDSGYNEDVYAFGAILHLLLSGRTAFGAIKMVLRPIFPEHIPADRLPQDMGIPEAVRELTSACLSPSPSQRPSMDQAAFILGRFSEGEALSSRPISVPIDDASMADKKKIMVFIKGDNRAIPLFDMVLRMASEEPAIFLFVGLIPNNLPSGHAERFKSSLFKKLGQGLMRCRAAELPWSLRVFENTDPERTAIELARQYQPDRLFLGESKKPHKIGAIRRGFQASLAPLEIHIELTY